MTTTSRKTPLVMKLMDKDGYHEIKVLEPGDICSTPVENVEYEFSPDSHILKLEINAERLRRDDIHDILANKEINVVSSSELKGFLRYGIDRLTPTKTIHIRQRLPEIKQVIYNKPATIIFWDDGTKTVVKCQKGDKYNKEKGFAMAVAKKALGNKSDWYNVFKKNGFK